jgi:hypothetical protein
MGEHKDGMRKLFLSKPMLLLFLLVIVTSATYSNSKTYFDVAGGRTRQVSYWFFTGTSRTIEETQISQLYRQLVGEPPAPKWLFMYGSMSVLFLGELSDGAGGGTFVASFSLAHALHSMPSSDESKRLVLIRFFDLLQDERSFERATKYAEAVASCKRDPALIPVPPAE